jgi:hypothetical protein
MRGAGGSRVEALAARSILAIGWIGFVVYAYPGYMSFDSVVQLREARAGTYTDWHPPAMAFLWHLLEYGVKGPIAMLLLQSGLYLGGCYGIVRRGSGPIYAAVAAVTCLLFPPIATVMAVIWKDSLMVALVAMAIALLLARPRWVRVVAVVLFTLAAAVRYNAFTLTFAPMVLLFRWRETTAGLRRYALASAVWVATVACAMLLNGALVTTQTHPWHGSVAMFDIVGTIRYAPPMSDAELDAVLEGTPVEVTTDVQARAHQAYSPEDGVFRIVDTITAAWRRLVFDHPHAYLAHRWRAFRALLGLQEQVQAWVWVGEDLVGADLVPNSPGRLQARLQRGALGLATTWIMRPYVYLLLVAALTLFGFADRNRVVIALGASALASELALLFLSPTPDFRYSLWLVVSALVMLFVTLRSRSRRAADQPGQAST